MTEQLSDWSQPGEKPPMAGVWETDYKYAYARTFQYWDGQEFRRASYSAKEAFVGCVIPSVCNQSKVRFRGIATKPENDDATE